VTFALVSRLEPYQPGSVAKHRTSALDGSPEWRALFAGLVAKAEIEERAVEAFAEHWGLKYDADLRELVRFARQGPH
jgi:hypothetical protein